MFLMESIWQSSGLLALGDDAGDWINLLVFIVAAVFWVIGGIVKAAGAGRKERQQKAKESRKTAGTPKKESLIQHLARKAEELQRVLQEQAEPDHKQRRTTRQNQPAKASRRPTGQVTVRQGKGGESVLVFERQDSISNRQNAAEPRRRTAPAVRQMPPAIETPSARVSKRTRTAMASEGPAATTSLFDYSDAEALKMAILHYEILGKPIALRDPAEGTTPF